MKQSSRFTLDHSDPFIHFGTDKMVGKADRLPGGLADKKKPSDFDTGDLADAVKVETEHTSDRALAREIGMDHLTEDKNYYRKLARMEGKMVGKAVACGDCYAWAYRYQKDHGGAVMHHGTVVAPTEKHDRHLGTHKRIHHAWIEENGRVKDWQTRKEHPNGISIEKFNREAKPDRQKSFPSHDDAIDAVTVGLREHGRMHFGPWHDPPEKVYMGPRGGQYSDPERKNSIKKSQLFVGPRGGKWADAAHKIPWKPPSFHEHATSDQLELLKKIRRRPEGEGEEITLSEEELHHILNGGKYALISAGPNPEIDSHKSMSKEDQIRRHEKLHAELVQRGLMHTDTVGHYQGRENTFLVMVHDANREEVRKLGEMFEQDSVIYSEGGKHELHYTHGENHDKNLCSDGKGWEAKPEAEDYFTDVSHPGGGHTKFALKINFGKLGPCAKSLIKSLAKAKGGPFIGPRGGKWADAKHTIPWKPGKSKAASKLKDLTKDERALLGLYLLTRLKHGSNDLEDGGATTPEGSLKFRKMLYGNESWVGPEVKKMKRLGAAKIKAVAKVEIAKFKKEVEEERVRAKAAHKKMLFLEKEGAKNARYDVVKIKREPDSVREQKRVSKKMVFSDSDISALDRWIEYNNVAGIRDASSRKNPSGPASKILKMIKRAERISRKPSMLFRGMALPGHILDRFLEEKVVTDAAVSSWSSNPDMAQFFTTGAGQGGREAVLLRVKSKRGVPVVAVSATADDEETILPPSQMRITKVSSWFYAPSSEYPAVENIVLDVEEV